MSRKRTSPIVIFLLIILSFVATFAIYLFLQVRSLTLEKTTSTPIVSTQPLDTWETYFNPSFNYQVNYFASDNQDMASSINMVNPEMIDFRVGCNNVKIYATTRKSSIKHYEVDMTENIISQLIALPLGQSLVFSIPNWHDEKFTYKQSYLKLNTETINGIVWTKLEESNNWEGMSRLFVYITRHAGNTYIIENQELGDCIGSEKAFKENSPLLRFTFDQILSTFKFTDQIMTYTCPQNGWQGCMPILSEEGKKACSGEAITWYKANCPGFKGIAQ